MESQQQHRKTRENSSRQAVSGDFRVEMTGTQESLDLDSGKFYTEYLLQCSWVETDGPTETWEVARRYREFSAVDILIREKYPSLASLFPLLPSKIYLGSSLSLEVVDKRQRELGLYIISILNSCPLLVQDDIIDAFLEIKYHILKSARERERQRQQEASQTSMSIGQLHRVSE